MTPKEIEQNLHQIVENIKNEDFIFDFLLAFGFPKSSITRIRKGDSNKSNVEGEVLYKDKIFFKEGISGQMMSDIENFSIDERILKQNPRFIILTDYESVVAKDLKTKASKEFPIKELPNFKDFFIAITGAEIYKSTNDNKADREASYALAQFYDIIIQDNPGLYEGNSHSLNMLLSRLLFCFFAEDTGIFEVQSMFTDAIANNTEANGSDLNVFLKELFAKLNSRKTNFSNSVKDFPYVNGGLFKDEIVLPKFSKKSRQILLDSGNLKWDEINPDIFGSMIQAVADPEERSDLGMHYTSVPNILKLIKPLFLDELYEEFKNNKDKPANLEKLLKRLSTIKFFDPACGSGNFLIITYKELRLLEIKIIQQLVDLTNENAVYEGDGQSKMDFDNPDVVKLSKPVQSNMRFGGKQAKIYYPHIELSQFYGIEIKDFAHEMAILSLWLAEHQMNKVFEQQLEGVGQTEPILPLKESGRITQGNAATYDWEKACPKSENDEIYIIGNPPYLGARVQDDKQKSEIEYNFKGSKGYNNLDYISIWFYKGAKYINGINAKLAFVSTNSICQGEQVSLFWPKILDKNIEIDFAYQSFKWQNNAKGNAGVSVIILGIRNRELANIKTKFRPKYLFNNKIKKEAKNINAYLLDSNDIYIIPRNSSISKLPEMVYGSMPNDGGFLLLSEFEKDEIIDKNSDSKNYIKKFIGAAEFMRGIDKYCLWINENDFNDAVKNPLISKRINSVRDFRNKSKRLATNILAMKPFAFGEIRYKEKDSILIPQTGSDRREYLPVGFFDKNYVISNAARVLNEFEPYLFGVLSSKIHIVWVKAVSGRMKDDVQYSNKISYNTFPFPPLSIKQKELINQYVFAILDERAKFPQKTMAWLYNPETMPASLKTAHQELDLAIEKIYRLAPFTSDAERLEYLFKMYDDMTKKDTLFAKEKKVRKPKTDKTK